MEILRRKASLDYTNNLKDMKKVLLWVGWQSPDVPHNGVEYDFDAERDIVYMCMAGGILHVEDVIAPNWFVL